MQVPEENNHSVTWILIGGRHASASETQTEMTEPSRKRRPSWLDDEKDERNVLYAQLQVRDCSDHERSLHLTHTRAPFS
jgi:hypothetical protein